MPDSDASGARVAQMPPPGRPKGANLNAGAVTPPPSSLAQRKRRVLARRRCSLKPRQVGLDAALHGGEEHSEDSGRDGRGSDLAVPSKRRRQLLPAQRTGAPQSTEHSSGDSSRWFQTVDSAAALQQSLPNTTCGEPQQSADVNPRFSEWATLGVPPCELRLAPTLMSGQSFRWERRVRAANGE